MRDSEPRYISISVGIDQREYDNDALDEPSLITGHTQSSMRVLGGLAVWCNPVNYSGLDSRMTGAFSINLITGRVERCVGNSPNQFDNILVSN
jgi:hypothetical protein